MPLLELKGVTKLFGKLAALEDIDLCVQEGEVLGICGPNGSGKTTLINVISGYYRPNRGTVYLEGGKISGLRPDQVAARGIARTFQANMCFSRATVLQSMLIGSFLQYKTNEWQAFFETKTYKERRKKIVGKVLETLKLLDLTNEANMPAAGLPHGHQRIFGIAMALMTNPSILLLDEPTTGMNHNEAVFVVDNIKKINERGITVILIEHNMKVLLDVATRAVVLNFGTKIAEGKPREVMKNHDVIDAYLGTETV
jgi:branched-chain amino acid transport system ATP-binding protein